MHNKYWNILMVSGNFHCRITGIYRVMQNPRAILKDVLRRLFVTENANKISQDSPPFRRNEFLTCMSLLLFIVEFYKVETISFNIKCQ
jgi:hypothetical protein